MRSGHDDKALPALAGVVLSREGGGQGPRSGPEALSFTADGAGGSRLRGPAAVLASSRACTYVRYSSLAWVPGSPGVRFAKVGLWQGS